MQITRRIVLPLLTGLSLLAVPMTGVSPADYAPLFSFVVEAGAQPASEDAAPQETNAPQNQFLAPLVAELKSLQQAALESDYAYRQLRHLTNNIGPRISGSPQATHAAEYVANQLRRLGLYVHLEEVTVPHWVRGVETAELVVFPGQAPGTTQKIVLTALGNSSATPPRGLTAGVVVVNNYDELNALGKQRIAGKIVLFNEKFDKRMAAQGYSFVAYGQAVAYRAGAAKAAAPLGAVATLVRSVGSADYRLPHTGGSTPAGIPAGAVTAEDADLIAHLVTEGPVRMHLTLTPQTLPDAIGYNVIGDIKGSEHPEQIVIVSGHLDSWDLGTGAIDDGAGVVMAMATAQLVQQLHLRPRRTLRIIAWMDEEQTQSGAKAYAEEFKAQISNHVGAIESDGGAGHPVGFNASVVRSALPMLEPIQEILQSSGASIIQHAEKPDVGTDIAPLTRQGVPGFGLMQDGRTYFNYHHTAADTLDKVDPHELAENVAAMAVLGYALACMPEPLPR
jgi:carboxypeptidase Q